MAHKITSQDQWFLSLRRRDPLQGSEFQLGDKVVVCTKCKCVQAYDSWEFNENKCVQCGHNHNTDDFSREYIDYSYHRENASSRVIRGFKVVESDIKYQTDRIRKWFSQQRISKTYKVNIWFDIFLVIAILGLIYYLEQDSIEYFVSSMVTPVFSRAFLKLQNVPLKRLSDIGILSKLRSLNLDPDRFVYKYTYIQGKLILLATSLVYIVQKIVYSTSRIGWKNKIDSISTNYHTLIDYITHIFKR